MNQAVRTVRRGDVYLADLDPAIGCEQGGIRPVLVLQNDIGNLYSPTTIVAAVTAKQTKKKLPVQSLQMHLVPQLLLYLTHFQIQHSDRTPELSP